MAYRILVSALVPLAWDYWVFELIWTWLGLGVEGLGPGLDNFISVLVSKHNK